MRETVYLQKSIDVDKQMVREGFSSQTDAKLLSLFLTRSKRQSPLQLAESILASVPLSRLYNESRVPSLLDNGLTDHQIAMVFAGMELARRSVQQQLVNKDALTSPQLVREYIQLRISGQEYEVFSALFLDNQHRVIEYTELFRGTIDSTVVYPREIVKSCLNSNAAAVIFCHNHPSGLAEPSDTDVRLTRRLIDALALIDVRVLDHLVLGKGVSTSMAERGLM